MDLACPVLNRPQKNKLDEGYPVEAFIPDNEAERLQALYSHAILDTEPEESFDKIIRSAADEFDVPIATFTLIDAKRQWFKSRLGLDVAETDRAFSLCAHVVAIDGPLVIENTLKDDFFAEWELVTHAPFIRFYAGVPIRDIGQEALGTICIIDTNPRSFAWEDFRRLEDLAQEVEKALLERKARLKLN